MPIARSLVDLGYYVLQNFRCDKAGLEINLEGGGSCCSLYPLRLVNLFSFLLAPSLRQLEDFGLFTLLLVKQLVPLRFCHSEALSSPLILIHISPCSTALLKFYWSVAFEQRRQRNLPPTIMGEAERTHPAPGTEQASRRDRG